MCKGVKEGKRSEGSRTLGLPANDSTTGNLGTNIRLTSTEEGPRKPGEGSPHHCTPIR